MGLLDPAPPPFEVSQWRRLSHLERIKPLAQDWALNGFGTPVAVYFLYILKILVYAGGGALLIFGTSGWRLAPWHCDDPIVFQKAVIWTLLWEVLGLGAGSLPLTLRFKPMIGGVLYWLRPGRRGCRPGPSRCRARGGRRRTWLDVVLYAGLLASAAFLLSRRGSDAAVDPGHGGIPRPSSRPSTRSRSASSSRSSAPSACATRSRSWRRGRRSTAPWRSSSSSR